MAKSKIHIKPSKRGTFTKAAKSHGKSVQGFASQVLAHKGNYSPAMVKKANFARNASKWKHEDGGTVDGDPKFSKLDQRIYNAVIPYGYSNEPGAVLGQGINTLLGRNRFSDKNKDRNGIAEPYREELWKYSLGADDPLKYFEESKYRPSKSTDKNSKYLTPANLDKSPEVLKELLNELGDSDKIVRNKPLRTATQGAENVGAFGNYTVSKGQDEKGTYISIYDKWDLASKFANKFLDRKPEIYDRIYYQEDPKWIASEEFDKRYAKARKNNDLDEYTKIMDEEQKNRKEHDRYIIIPEYGSGGKVKNETGVKNGKFKGSYPVGTNLHEIFNVPSNISPYAQSLSAIETRNRLNQIRWANYTGQYKEWPKGQNVPSLDFTNPGVQAEMKRRGIDENYINSWQPTNYPDEFSLGGILGSAGGGALTGLSVGGPIGAAIGGGIGLIKGLFSHRKEKKQEEMLAQQQALQEQQLLQQPMLEPMPDIGTNPTGMINVENQYQPTFPMGGMIPYTDIPVELENDEVFRKPGDTKIHEVDGKYHSQGGEGYVLPEGTTILGKSINPITGRTFKQDGMKLKKKQDRILSRNSRPGTIGAESDKRNLAQISAKYDELFKAQEEMKYGGKVKRKMQDGGIVEMPFGGLASMAGNVFNFLQNRPAQGFANVGQSLLGGGDPTRITAAGAGVGGAAPLAQGFGQRLWQGAKNFIGNQGGLSGVLNAGMQLAPIGYNLAQGMQPAEHLNASDFYNPEYGNVIQDQTRAIDLLANRRFNVDPLLESNRNAQAIGSYNARNLGLGAGAAASNLLAGTAQRMRADQEAWATKQNKDNEYLAQQSAGVSNLAQMRAGLGAQQAATNFNVANINQQSDAARRSYLGQGFTDLSEYAQRQQLMKNQQQRDKDLLGLYPDMFSSVYPYMQGAQNIIKKYS